MSMNDEEYQLLSRQRKHNTSPLVEIPELSEILRQRNKHRSLTRKRTNSSKLNKDDIKYQRFVHGLQKEIQVYINQSLRESRFDTRANRCLESNPSFPSIPATLKSKRSGSTIGSQRTNETETIITSISNRHDPMSILKHNETKRLEADVQTILTGPAMKNFYIQFIRPPRQHHQLNSYETTILYASEQ
ncbi:unnamed protein product [Rotaria sp. Silwood2]|nr:unnamed protein product [Rotaria sp. Silwood2]CAF2644769.1 unnamed protein product [Rotaria sp. Silwood2]CAF2907731.1 unnamed protein product [Rotaria sp. Silwood2]CAF3071923.1 unnamed protein product [Rotaria sp. Silwood2]CAF3851828.1 unnamed protein product [Rotaria sp. Silwood2]